MDRTRFYAELRKRNSGVFGTSLTAGQVAGVDRILDEAERRRTPLRHLSYILATPYHETGGKMQPITENLNYSVQGLLKTFGRHRISAADAQRYGRAGGRPANQQAIANTIYGGAWGRKHLGNTEPGDGWKYRGMGLVQNTGRTNAIKFGIESNPEKALDPEFSVHMLFDGMERGIYTLKRLDDFTDYVSMRAIINGTDKAETIAGYARAFEKALRAAGYGMWKQPKPVVAKPVEPEPAAAPPQEPADAQKPSAGGKVAATGAFALVIAGVIQFACSLPLIWRLFDSCGG